jgi:hypothetical protein
LRQRWLGELAELGYRDRDKPVQLTLPLTGQLDRDVAAVEVLTRLGAVRSAWNAADARRNRTAARPHRDRHRPRRPWRLAEDLTARAVELCVPLREQPTRSMCGRLPPRTSSTWKQTCSPGSPRAASLLWLQSSWLW